MDNFHPMDQAQAAQPSDCQLSRADAEARRGKSTVEMEVLTEKSQENSNEKTWKVMGNHRKSWEKHRKSIGDIGHVRINGGLVGQIIAADGRLSTRPYLVTGGALERRACTRLLESASC